MEGSASGASETSGLRSGNDRITAKNGRATRTYRTLWIASLSHNINSLYTLSVTRSSGDFLTAKRKAAFWKMGELPAANGGFCEVGWRLAKAR